MDDELRAQLDQISARLDHMEQFLVRVGKKNGPDYTPTAGFVPAPADVVELARNGDTGGAVERYRELTGADLTRAQAVVEGL